MNSQELTKLFLRDLDKLAEEMRSYQNSSIIWKTPGEVNNSSGNLCVHLCGNLQHFIGAILGESGYIRDRHKEFNCTDIPVSQMLLEIERTKAVVSSTLSDLDPEQLSKNYPLEVFGSKMTCGYFLLHLLGHLNYHLGQISYHRRILDAI